MTHPVLRAAIVALLGASACVQKGPPPPLKPVSEIMEAAPASAWLPLDPDNTVVFEVRGGAIVIALSPDLAQRHVEQFKTLVGEGFYDGLDFYRVVHGFVAQGGDQAGTKDKGSAADALVAEFDEPAALGLDFTPLGYHDGYAATAGFTGGMPAGRGEGRVWLAHCAGAVAFARDTERDTASTEFYITLQPQRYLDRNLTVVGRVVYGMDVVQAIPRGAFGSGGVIENRDDWTKIRSARLLRDAQGVVPELDMMDTSSETFRALISARANRGSGFFYHRPNHIDLCQMPIPVRVAEPKAEIAAAP